MTSEPAQVFSCSRGAPVIGPCSVCGWPASLLCDWPTSEVAFGKEPTTCDKPLCRADAVHVGVNLDHCPDHEGTA